ncbi:MAG: ABC transporter permease [Synechococcales bacterium]|nr:ABC transporter permease [Synechococcales bacterium]
MNVRVLIKFRSRDRSPLEGLVSLLSVLGAIAIWQAIAYFEWVPRQFLPTPLSVLEALHHLLTQQAFLTDIWVSMRRVWEAFLLAAIAAIPLGILMSTYRLGGAIFEPIIDFIRYLPIPALVPLLIIWLGVGEASKIAILWMGTFFQLVLLVADDARRVPREYVEIGFTLGATPLEIIRDIIIPAMLPNLIDNLRITLGWCWTYLIVAEIVASNSGIGHVIWSMRRFVRTPEVMAGILTVGVIGLLSDQAFRLGHRLYFRYLN